MLHFSNIIPWRLSERKNSVRAKPRSRKEGAWKRIRFDMKPPLRLGVLARKQIVFAQSRGAPKKGLEKDWFRYETSSAPWRLSEKTNSVRAKPRSPKEGA